ncbi:hypothetical protein ATO6_01845 [Oceanicola sp. 22II-s10i]|nr:hypothetical protein ATO6_01845 [Oceanicola sp. 22II-s10i]
MLKRPIPTPPRLAGILLMAISFFIVPNDADAGFSYMCKTRSGPQLQAAHRQSLSGQYTYFTLTNLTRRSLKIEVLNARGHKLNMTLGAGRISENIAVFMMSARNRFIIRCT